MKKLTTIIIVLILLILSGSVVADDLYVVTGTYKTQKEAQDISAMKGGWVLNTNFYNQLTPNLFAVVRGPFMTKKEADKRLARLTDVGGYPGSYVKNAGSITIQVNLGNKALSPQMIAALLGELRIDIYESKGRSHPCEPQEPYKEISLSFVSIARDYDKKNDVVIKKPDEVKLDVGAFREISSTGEVDRMRICSE